MAAIDQASLKLGFPMRNAVAFANNDVATIAWSYGAKPDGCMGFALYRIDSNRAKKLCFRATRCSRARPLHRADDRAVPYPEVLLEGCLCAARGRQDGKLHVPLQGRASRRNAGCIEADVVTADPDDERGDYFRRMFPKRDGDIQSRPYLDAACIGCIEGQGNPEQPAGAIKVSGNQLRKDLAGDILGTLTGFVARAKKGGSIYAALYELTDVELVQSLVGIGDKLNIVLANIVAKPKPGGSEEMAGENDDSETKLKASAASLLYRRPPSGHIVHNKFLIYVDASGTPQAVLTGSCNWTDTGLCAQTNNSIVIRGQAGRGAVYGVLEEATGGREGA